MERITVTVCWVAPDGTLQDLRNQGADKVVVEAAFDVVASGVGGSLIFVNATSEEA